MPPPRGSNRRIAEMQVNNASSFTLSFAHADDVARFECAAAAGRAFAEADASLEPRVIVLKGRGTRLVAKCVRIKGAPVKSAPALANAEADLVFWAGFHGSAAQLAA
jgi:hypothetical protein